MTTTAIRCERPGCGGTIDGGYCDTCGLAPEPAAPAAPAPAAGPATCQRPGRGGTIQDGYCDTCGMAPAPASAMPGTSSASGSASSGTTGTTGRTGSRRTRSGSSRSSRGHLGAGLVDVPPVPARDPASAVLKDPKVAESKRFCAV